MLGQQHEPLRIPIRERAEQYGIHDAEHRAIGADSQSHREHSDEGESGTIF
jgi:hypothetical protein